MISYKPSNRVGWCRTGDRIVFLNLDADRYFCLGRELERSFVALIGERPVDAQDLAALSRAGIVVAANGGRLTLCTALPAQQALVGDDAAPLNRVVASLALRARWAIRVKRRTLAANIDWLVDRRALLATAPVEPTEASAVIAAYRQARLWWAEQGHCLSTSLALMEDLIERDLAPSLVFAVRLGPFEAHCWIELDGLLVNETPERVAPFTPIMVI